MIQIGIKPGWHGAIAVAVDGKITAATSMPVDRKHEKSDAREMLAGQPVQWKRDLLLAAGEKP